MSQAKLSMYPCSCSFPILATGPSIFLVAQAKQTLESSWALLLSQSTSDPSVNPAVSTFKTYRNFAHHFYVYHPNPNHHHLFLVHWKGICYWFLSFTCFSKLTKVTSVRRYFKKHYNLELNASEELVLKTWPPGSIVQKQVLWEEVHFNSINGFTA